MERHQNQNAFTWKRMKLTVCITVQVCIPIQECDHDGFQSQRGCRKHVNSKHSWFFYFDEKPNSEEIADSLKVFSNRGPNSRSNKQDHNTCRKVTSLIFIIVRHWRSIREMVDWKWWRLQERPCSTKNSCKML